MRGVIIRGLVLEALADTESEDEAVVETESSEIESNETGTMVTKVIEKEEA